MTQYLSQLSLARLLAASLLVGLALGGLYDVFRIRRLAFDKLTLADKPKRIFAALMLHTEDILFGISAGIVTAILYFALSQGRVRLMAIAGEGFGFLLYRLTIGRLVMAFADSILRLIAWVIRLIVRYLIRPPLRLIVQIAKVLGGQIVAIVARLRRWRLIAVGRREAERYTEMLERLAALGFAEEAYKIVKKRLKAKKQSDKKG